MSNPPRELTEDQKRDARLIATLMPEIDRYVEGRGIFHFCGGDHYPNLLRDRADEVEAATPVLRRMADFLDPSMQETTNG